MWSPRRRLAVVVCLLGAVAAGSVWVVLDIWRRDPGPASDGDRFDPKAPQCGHWAILRSCELLGVPIDMRTILEMLPPDPAGASILELRDVLGEIGLNATGVRASFSDLVKGPLPAIAYLPGNRHFVVVSKASAEAVRLFDMAGRAMVRGATAFRTEWNGALLLVERGRGNVPLPRCANRSRQNGPCIEFDTLIIDKGNVPWRGEPIPYRFAVRNTGAAPLVIESVKTDCGCLQVEKPARPIAPGQASAITVRYSLQGQRGSFKHETVVKSNDPSVPLVRLTAAGSTEAAVVVYPQSVRLGRVLPGQTKTATLSVHSVRDYPLDLRGVSCRNGEVVVVGSRLSPATAKQLMGWRASDKGILWVQPNTHVLQVRYEAGIEDVGKTVRDTIVIRTNVDGYEDVLVPVSGYVAAPVVLCPSIVALMDVDPAEKIDTSVRVVSVEGRAFRVTAVRAGDAEISYSTVSEDSGGTILALSAPGAVLIGLSGHTVDVEVELGEASPERFALKLDVYAQERRSATSGVGGEQ